MSILDQEWTDCCFYLYIFCLSVCRCLVFLVYFISRIYVGLLHCICYLRIKVLISLLFAYLLGWCVLC